ncbi:MAG: class I SAM-dependent methyltransferase [Planctomycetes bacterium]|nr:class I SAM-dependent methyltransferase [Planctomycetota bacterium]
MSTGAPKSPVGRVGVVHGRTPLLARLNAWRKRSPLSPYWLDWKFLRGAIEKLAPSARGVMLDVGCSERPYGELFAPYVTRYVGLDYPPALLDKQPELWKILDRAKRSVDVFGDGRRLPFADASFETVLSTEVLEHVLSPRAVVEEMARVLKPGGRLLVTVPFMQPLHEIPSDFYRYTPFALRRMVEETGLVVEVIEPRGNFAASLGALGSQYLLRSFGASERQSDGSVIPSRWKSLIVFPAAAFLQTAFYLLSKVTTDDAVALGYSIVARKPEAPGGGRATLSA